MERKLKDPARKRTVNPEEDVAVLLGAWERDNPHVMFARMYNEALRRHLKDYGMKRAMRNGKAVAA